MARCKRIIFLLIIIVLLILALPVTLPGEVGAIDFRPYWSSTVLLARGQDFGDPLAMDRFEREQTGWQKPYTMLAWFAPTGNLIFLPFTIFPFDRAVHYWLLTNIIVVFSSAMILGRAARLKRWVGVLAVFSFSMTMVALIAGQVNTLVLLGLALFFHFSAKQQGGAAGASLVLTTIKPHLVILALPLLLLDQARRRRWSVLAGFGGGILGCGLILFILNPSWVEYFIRLVSLGMETDRETPTLSGLLMTAGMPGMGKFLWLGVLAVAVCLWWLNGKGWQVRSMVDLSLIAGFVVSPIGWSYDQIMLIVPLMRVMGWAVDGSLPRRASVILLVVLGLANLATYIQRALSPSDVGFFWVPLACAGVYLFACLRRQPSSGVIQDVL